MATLSLDHTQVQDVVNISNRVYAPLGGFLGQADFQSVLKKKRLADGSVWPIPIVLDITEKQYRQIRGAKSVTLVDKTGTLVAHLHQPEIYSYNKQVYAHHIFGTTSRKHPGVTTAFNMGPFLIGGKTQLVNNPLRLFPKYNLTPTETKKYFQESGWKTVAAFQTRNVPHRGHEFLQKQALKHVDGLMVQPVIGRKKNRDFKDEYIIASYHTLIERFYPLHRTLLTVLPLKMRYAGPRETLMHALIRKNFGCTHFIVGRDHAGVGGFYEPFASQKIFEQFTLAELGIEIMKFSEVVYDQKNQTHAFVDNVPLNDRVYFSGTKLRNFVNTQQEAPEFIIRDEVLQTLKTSHTVFVDKTYQANQPSTGFTLWFTGLSGSGKSTIADTVHQLLEKRAIRLERLDGDIVRESLTRDLGFSQEDRNENIRRVGFVANLLAKNGVGVIASFISPYSTMRQKLREKTHNFIEVFVNTPLEICEQRDAKGLYKKARRGEIKNFTGISDPYEAPQNPEIELSAINSNPLPYAEQVIEYLKKNNYL